MDPEYWGRVDEEWGIKRCIKRGRPQIKRNRNEFNLNANTGTERPVFCLLVREPNLTSNQSTANEEREKKILVIRSKLWKMRSGTDKKD